MLVQEDLEATRNPPGEEKKFKAKKSNWGRFMNVMNIIEILRFVLVRVLYIGLTSWGLVISFGATRAGVENGTECSLLKIARIVQILSVVYIILFILLPSMMCCCCCSCRRCVGILGCLFLLPLQAVSVLVFTIFGLILCSQCNLDPNFDNYESFNHHFERFRIFLLVNLVIFIISSFFEFFCCFVIEVAGWMECKSQSLQLFDFVFKESEFNQLFESPEFQQYMDDQFGGRQWWQNWRARINEQRRVREGGDEEMPVGREELLMDIELSDLDELSTALETSETDATDFTEAEGDGNEYSTSGSDASSQIQEIATTSDDDGERREEALGKDELNSSDGDDLGTTGADTTSEDDDVSDILDDNM